MYRGLLLLSCLVVSSAQAQRPSLEAGLTQILEAGDGVHSGCDQRIYSTGLGASLTVPITRNILSLAATGVVYPQGRGPTCFTDIFVPSDGTFTINDRVELQGTRFLTSDLRLQVSPANALVIAAGGGIAWHPGKDFPFMVGAVKGRLPPVGRIRLLVGAEYYLVRTSWNETSVTYEHFVPVNSVPLGTRHKLSSALALSVAASLTL